MDSIDMAHALNDYMGTSTRKQEPTVGRTRTYSGMATTDSSNGYVFVDIDGDSVTQDGSQAVKMQTVVSVLKGQKVTVTVVNGVPTVTGVVGWGDVVRDNIQTLNGFKTTVEQDYATKTELEQTATYIQTTVEGNIILGGQNLLLDTDAPTLTKVEAAYDRYFSDSGNTEIVPSIIPCPDPPVAGIQNMQQYVINDVTRHRQLVFYTPSSTDALEYEDGAKYTISCYARLTSGSIGIIEIRCNAFDVAGTRGHIEITNTEWQRFSWTYTANSSSGVFRPEIGVFGTYVCTIQICGIKLEKGTYPTDWSLAPQEIASKSLVTQTADSLSSAIQNCATSSELTQTAESLSSEIENCATRSELQQTASTLQSTIEGNIILGGSNLLLDTDAPTLTKVSAAYNRYFSDSGNTGITPSIVACTDPPVVGIQNMQRYVVANSSAGHRNLTFYNSSTNAIKYENGEKYTISCYARLTSGTKGTVEMRCNAFGVTGTAAAIDITNAEWKRYSWTYTANSSSGLFKVYVGTYGRYVSTVEICGIKVEKGTYPTDWCLAPEETASKSLVTQTASSLSVDITNAAKTATSYLNFDSNGLCVGDMEASTLGNNVLVSSDGIDIRDNTTIFARIRSKLIQLGRESIEAVIQLCNNKGNIACYDNGSGSSHVYQMFLYAANGVMMTAADDRTSVSQDGIGFVKTGTDPGYALVNAQKFLINATCNSECSSIRTVDSDYGIYAYRNQFGIVQVYSNATVAFPAGNQNTSITFATALPTGWRPKAQVYNVVYCGGAVGLMRVNTNGKVYYERTGGATTMGGMYGSVTFVATNSNAV